MDFHQSVLSGLCRLCGEKIVTSVSYIHPKSVNEYSNMIYSVYSIDCDAEPSHVFPKHLCSKCRRKLDRLRDKTQTPHLRACHFEAHDSNCVICIPHNSKKETRHMRLFDNAMTDYKFIICSDPYVKRKYILLADGNENVSAKLTIAIDKDFLWSIRCYGKLIMHDNLFLMTLPKVLTDTNIQLFAKLLSELNVCDGNTTFNDIVQSKLEIRNPFEKEGKIIAVVENKQHVPLQKTDFTIVRHSDCTVFCDVGNICEVCLNHQSSLRKSRARIKNLDEGERKAKWVLDTSTTNLKYLSREELEARLQNTQKQKRDSLRRIAKMSITISKLIATEGVCLENDHQDALSEIIKSDAPPFDNESPQWLLWEQQKEQASKTDSRGMRWHPLIIRWCLSIYHTSPAAYAQLASKKLQFLQLPHINTLKKFTDFTTPSAGFNPDILQRLIVDTDIENLPECKRNVTLVFDEMKIKSDLIYRKSTGQLIGFTELGEMNEEFKLFEKKFEEKSTDTDRQFATYVLVFMVRGIVASFCYPFAFFASVGFTSAQLYPCALQAVIVLESLGFLVRAFVSDGASPNRKFYKLMCVDEGDIYWTINPCDDSRKIYYISDVPHLLKTTRNCLENSFWNKNSRNMHVSLFICFYYNKYIYTVFPLLNAHPLLSAPL